jgi:hypothetical protein
VVYVFGNHDLGEQPRSGDALGNVLIGHIGDDDGGLILSLIGLGASVL